MTKSKLTDQNLSEKVTELEKLVEIISRSKMMWEATFDVISDPVMIINRKFEITRANKALAKACGMDIRAVIQKKCYEVFAGYSFCLINRIFYFPQFTFQFHMFVFFYI